MKNIPEYRLKHNKKENTLILSASDIEKHASNFLQEYSKSNQNYSITNPQQTPIEEIIEIYCDISMDFQTFANSAILGMTTFSNGNIEIVNNGIKQFHSIEKNTIIISNELAEDERKRGRFFYTLAHEFGHCFYHKKLFEEIDDSNQLLLFENKPENIKSITCHRDNIENLIFLSTEKNWTEWQADYFASCILMPKEAVQEFWKTYITESEFVFGENVKPYLYGMSKLKQDSLFAEFIDTFKVSKQAARIRLEKLNYFERRKVS